MRPRGDAREGDAPVTLELLAYEEEEEEPAAPVPPLLFEAAPPKVGNLCSTGCVSLYTQSLR
jgi:hypothetical protein